MPQGRQLCLQRLLPCRCIWEPSLVPLTCFDPHVSVVSCQMSALECSFGCLGQDVGLVTRFANVPKFLNSGARISPGGLLRACWGYRIVIFVVASDDALTAEQ